MARALSFAPVNGYDKYDGYDGEYVQKLITLKEFKEMTSSPSFQSYQSPEDSINIVFDDSLPDNTLGIYCSETETEYHVGVTCGDIVFKPIKLRDRFIYLNEN